MPADATTPIWGLLSPMRSPAEVVLLMAGSADRIPGGTPSRSSRARVVDGAAALAKISRICTPASAAMRCGRDGVNPATRTCVVLST